MITLKTPRLILRDFKPADFDSFYATTQDADYQQFYSEEEVTSHFWQQIFDKIIKAQGEKPRLKYQLAICNKTGTLMGTCGIRIEDVTNQQASFGCAIARPYWGEGVAFEAAQHLFTFGFSELPIHRIFAETNAENVNARRLAERLGMRQEAALKETRFFRGRWWHTVIYALLKDEWQGLAP